MISELGSNQLGGLKSKLNDEAFSDNQSKNKSPTLASAAEVAPYAIETSDKFLLVALSLNTILVNNNTTKLEIPIDNRPSTILR